MLRPNKQFRSILPVVAEVVAVLVVVAAGCAVVDTLVGRALPTVGKGRVPKLAVDGTVREGNKVFSVCVVIGASAVTEGSCVAAEVDVGTVVSIVAWTVVDGRSVLVGAVM